MILITTRLLLNVLHILYINLSAKQLFSLFIVQFHLRMRDSVPSLTMIDNKRRSRQDLPSAMGNKNFFDFVGNFFPLWRIPIKLARGIGIDF